MEGQLPAERNNKAAKLAKKRRNDEQLLDGMGDCPSKVSTGADSVHEEKSENDPGSAALESLVPVGVDLPPPEPKRVVPEVEVTTPGLAIDSTGKCKWMHTAGNVSQNPDLSVESNSPGPSRASRQIAAKLDDVARKWKVADHLPGKKSESPPIQISRRDHKDYPDLPDYTSSDTSSSSSGESSDYMRRLAGANWRKSVRAKPGIVPAEPKTVVNQAPRLD